MSFQPAHDPTPAEAVVCKAVVAQGESVVSSRNHRTESQPLKTLQARPFEVMEVNQFCHTGKFRMRCAGKNSVRVILDGSDVNSCNSSADHECCYPAAFSS